MLGHEVIGRVDKLGDSVTTLKEGDRVGVGWIHSSSGEQDENVSPEFKATGRDVNGGYAEYMIVPENYAYAIPKVFPDEQAAPLLCAGSVGYRALKLTNLRDGQLLGVGICDLTPTALSTVYFFFDPAQSRRSLGIHSSLVEIEVARSLGLHFYYVGYWVPGCGRMEYKSGFRPAEGLCTDGRWRPLEAALPPVGPIGRPPAEP